MCPYEKPFIVQIDPEEERKLLAKEKKASRELYNNTLKRHTLVLKKRDLMRKKAEEEKKKVISQLLAAEGLELDTDEDDVWLIDWCKHSQQGASMPALLYGQSKLLKPIGEHALLFL